jgi:thiol-disulfide isomerase/thioredoxin
VRRLVAIMLCLVAVSAATPAHADRVQVYSLQGADCEDCSVPVMARLKKIKAVKKSSFDMHKVEFTVTLADGTPDQTVLDAIAAAGFKGLVGAGHGAYLPNESYPAGADVKVVSADGAAVGSLEKLRVPGKYTVLDFYADWCGPCRTVDARLRELTGKRSDLAVRKLNVVSFDSPLAKQMGSKLVALPHVVVYAPDGRETVVRGADLKKLDAALSAR